MSDGIGPSIFECCGLTKDANDSCVINNTIKQQSNNIDYGVGCNKLFKYDSDESDDGIPNNYGLSITKMINTYGQKQINSRGQTVNTKIQHKELLLPFFHISNTNTNKNLIDTDNSKNWLTTELTKDNRLNIHTGQITGSPPTARDPLTTLYEKNNNVHDTFGAFTPTDVLETVCEMPPAKIADFPKCTADTDNLLSNDDIIKNINGDICSAVNDDKCNDTFFEWNLDKFKELKIDPTTKLNYMPSFTNYVKCRMDKDNQCTMKSNEESNDGGDIGPSPSLNLDGAILHNVNECLYMNGCTKEKYGMSLCSDKERAHDYFSEQGYNQNYSNICSCGYDIPHYHELLNERVSRACTIAGVKDEPGKKTGEESDWRKCNTALLKAYTDSQSSAIGKRECKNSYHPCGGKFIDDDVGVEGSENTQSDTIIGDDCDVEEKDTITQVQFCINNANIVGIQGDVNMDSSIDCHQVINDHIGNSSPGGSGNTTTTPPNNGGGSGNTTTTPPNNGGDPLPKDDDDDGPSIITILIIILVIALFAIGGLYMISGKKQPLEPLEPLEP